jgi:16S rRNA (guanine527-N7)-methyltransferase
MQIGSAKWKALIRKGADRFDLPLDPTDLEKFADHARELLRWNKKTNLTAISDPTEIAVKHFLDSLGAAAVIPSGGTLLDVGSGAGFPGIPLKIVRPALWVTLIDASRKKVSFLKHVLRLLGLEHADARHLRADELARMISEGRGDPRAQVDPPAPFDTVISRALSSLEMFVALALPLVAENGRIIALKGRISDSELEGARRMVMRASGSETDAPQISIKRYKLPLLEADRSLVTIQPGALPD